MQQAVLPMPMATMGVASPIEKGLQQFDGLILYL